MLLLSKIPLRTNHLTSQILSNCLQPILKNLSAFKGKIQSLSKTQIRKDPHLNQIKLIPLKLNQSIAVMSQIWPFQIRKHTCLSQKWALIQNVPRSKRKVAETVFILTKRVLRMILSKD
jgi:hypothetical protein